jgi:predicted RNase H-like nuclease (RuvC/YqgF family)|tara:strand:+ start:22 stop:195 length:174 start_codon:yes stop_codon:yes gene_type:complete
MHEKIKKLSGLVDKLIEQNYKLKTEFKSQINKITELENEISTLQKENQKLLIKKNNE